MISFGGDTTDGDQLSFVDCVAVKLRESTTLTMQASNNTKEQFANSPDLDSGLMNAIIAALDAHTSLSTQALNSEAVRNGLKAILLGPARLLLKPSRIFYAARAAGGFEVAAI